MAQTRKAVVRGLGVNLDSVADYLPANYRVVGYDDSSTVKFPVVLIEGEDDHGWNLDEYVIPRLASGLFFAEEVK